MNMHSEQIDQITVALAKAQKKIENPTKDAKNPFFKSSYADLAGVLEVCREPLADNGLALTQFLHINGDKPCLVTMLSHTSGQWIKSYIDLPILKPGPQELGSCITYCRRYALAALVGIYQVDDDAEAVEAPNRGGGATITEKQHEFLMNKLQALGDGGATTFLLEELQIESLRQMPKGEFNRTLEWVTKKIDAKKGGRRESTAA